MHQERGTVSHPNMCTACWAFMCDRAETAEGETCGKYFNSINETCHLLTHYPPPPHTHTPSTINFFPPLKKCGSNKRAFAFYVSFPFTLMQKRAPRSSEPRAAREHRKHGDAKWSRDADELQASRSSHCVINTNHVTLQNVKSHRLKGLDCRSLWAPATLTLPSLFHPCSTRLSSFHLLFCIQTHNPVF